MTMISVNIVHAEEIEKAKRQDPIITFAAYLKEDGVLTDEFEKEME